MKKVALVFVLAVIGPSLVLAWLAVRSLRDQQFLLERQQSLLYQGVADGAANRVADALIEYQRTFTTRVTALLRGQSPQQLAKSFDEVLRKDWPLAQVGFVVTATGNILSPSPYARPETRAFCADNGRFLANRESVEVYWNPKVTGNSVLANAPAPAVAQVQDDSPSASQSLAANAPPPAQNTTSAQQPNRNDTSAGLDSNSTSAPNLASEPPSQANAQAGQGAQNEGNNGGQNYRSFFNNNNTGAKLEQRNVVPKYGFRSGQNLKSADFSQAPLSKNLVPPAPNAPAPSPSTVTAGNDGQPAPDSRFKTRAPSWQPSVPPPQSAQTSEDDLQFSKVSASEAEFRQLIGDDSEGTLARFVDNKLDVIFWCRSPRDPSLIFGVELALARLVDELKPLVQQVEAPLQDEICVALLDDLARPVALSHPGFHASWKHPFVATEIGESLPHWEVAVYLLDPAKLTRSAHTLKLTLGLLIALLLLAIGVGSWLIVTDLNRQLTLARQKTDFVSNVSHELKTPLTSIRMFSELLAEGRVNDPAKQRSYLGIITAETARLTRLINNVLDFARLERGEKKYRFHECDVVEVVRETAATYRPHLEANGFQFECELPPEPVSVHADRDALAQVVVNLLSNAEKYSDSRKEIRVQVVPRSSPLPHVEIRVLDRGLGVPSGCEEKIFEKFYRAHDSLSSGIQGSGLGLTLARQVARAHGGDVAYERREGGGSCFVLRLPLQIQNPDASEHN